MRQDARTTPEPAAARRGAPPAPPPTCTEAGAGGAASPARRSGRILRPGWHCATPRKRLDDSDDDELFLTPKSVRESVPSRHTMEESEPATFALPGSVTKRLVERASPNKLSVAAPRASPPMQQHGNEDAARPAQGVAYELDGALPMPRAAQLLQEFHGAVEQSLLVHMATHGAPAAETEAEGPCGGRRVRISNVIPFQTLRPMVERTCRRTFSPPDFRRLVWVWMHAMGDRETAGSARVRVEDAAAEADGPETRHDAARDGSPCPLAGMGFLVSRVRSIDPLTRRRAYDWAIGLEMTYNRPVNYVRVVTPPLEVGFGDTPKRSPAGHDGCSARTPEGPAARARPARPSTPPPDAPGGAGGPNAHRVPLPHTPPRRRPAAAAASPEALLTSPDPRVGQREDMSNLAVWNNGLEDRRAELARRLRVLLAQKHAAFLQGHGLPVEPLLTEDAETRSLRAPPLFGSPSPAPQLPDSYMPAWQPPVSPSRAPRHARPAPPTCAPPATPEKTHIPTGFRLGADGLLTPTATRTSESHAARIRDRAPWHSAHGADAMLSPPGSPLADRSAKAARRSASPSPVRHPASPPRTRVATRTLVRWHAAFLASVDAAELVPQASLPSLHPPAPVERIKRTPAPTADVSQPTGGSLEERIRAKEQARMHACGKSALAGAGPGRLHARSILSRLGETADALHVLYTSSGAPAAHTRTGRQTRVLPLSDVLATLESSSKTVLSRRESDAAVRMLMAVAPGWLETRRVGGREWLRLHNDPGAGLALRDVRARIAAAAAADQDGPVS
ncbi:hypothetical protein MSPP1_002867 [Malassezia sp. CBS 17886]|nr:hypothetical protein MSPP1_002867 [Malassezia sp. CBS 17886]